MAPHVLGFLPSWGRAYVPPHWLWLEVRQLQLQLMVNVKPRCSWSVVREGCAPRCSSLRMLVHPAPQSLTSWGSPAGTPGGISAKLIASSTKAHHPPAQAAFGWQQLWTRSSRNGRRGPMWELRAWARPKSWPARSPGKVATGGSNLHTAAAMRCCCCCKSLQSCPTLCDPTDGSPPGSPVPGILQARTLHTQEHRKGAPWAEVIPEPWGRCWSIQLLDVFYRILGIEDGGIKVKAVNELLLLGSDSLTQV